MFHRIIVLCTGNICRSPIAEVLLQQRLSSKGIEVSSAGIAALIDHPADPMAQQVMQESGYDLSRHRARQATLPLLSSTDLILTMEQAHNDWIKARFPQLLGRTYKLGRWQNNMDVADPYRRPKPAFEQALQDISRHIDDWVRRVTA